MNLYFVGFLAVRHEIYGSLMIRALVSTMYKHAGHRHMCEIFKNVSSLFAYYAPAWKKIFSMFWHLLKQSDLVI